MAAKIQVQRIADGVFQVTVSEGASRTSHRVTLQSSYYQQITDGKVDAAELVRHSFEFLLKHEPKESILSKFDLTDISRYFPNFERDIKRQLSDT
jgi:hypothetical protein